MLASMISLRRPVHIVSHQRSSGTRLKYSADTNRYHVIAILTQCILVPTSLCQHLHLTFSSGDDVPDEMIILRSFDVKKAVTISYNNLSCNVIADAVASRRFEKTNTGPHVQMHTGSANMGPIIIVHGGAGDIPDSRVSDKIRGVKKSVDIGYEILRSGGSALDAVEAAVKYMEDDEAFNAGYGSVLNLDGEVEMDASIMVGSNLKAGAVTVVKNIKHPISLARMVMEKTPHLLLAGAGANKFAKEQGVPAVPSGSLISPTAQEALERFKKEGGDLTEIGHKNPGDVGTVGAVALDCNGNLAAATSTGGINGKMVGRSSDTSMIGSGTYADDNFGAVSTTGHGETIAKFCLAHNIVKEIEFGKNAQAATEESLKRMTARLNNTAGAITLSKDGQPGIYFTSNRMAWAYKRGNTLNYGIDRDENKTETL